MLREAIAKRLFIGYLRNEDFNDKSISFLQGLVHAKTQIMLDDTWMVDMAKQVRGIKYAAQLI